MYRSSSDIYATDHSQPALGPSPWQHPQPLPTTPPERMVVLLMERDQTIRYLRRDIEILLQRVEAMRIERDGYASEVQSLRDSMASESEKDGEREGRVPGTFQTRRPSKGEAENTRPSERTPTPNARPPSLMMNGDSLTPARRADSPSIAPRMTQSVERRILRAHTPPKTAGVASPPFLNGSEHAPTRHSLHWGRTTTPPRTQTPPRTTPRRDPSPTTYISSTLSSRSRDGTLHASQNREPSPTSVVAQAIRTPKRKPPKPPVVLHF